MGQKLNTLYMGVFILLVAVGCNETQSRSSNDTDMPAYEVEASWPQMLPNNWILGEVAGVEVDSRDHIWIAQRPTTLTDRQAGAVQDPPIALCCEPAPGVIEFDQDGNVVQAWGGPSDEFDWTTQPHGIFIDHQDNVWIGGGFAEHQVLKFTRDGEFLMQIGDPNIRGGSNDTDLLGGPTDIVVDAETNEVYISDGYANRRVIVFDAETGEYLRHWGAYGDVPHDEPLGRYDPDAEPARQFRGPVHGIDISNDGLVYVTDRGSNRVQVFRKDGEFVDEVFIRTETLSMGSTWDVAFSEDPDQRWLYIPDGTNKVVWVVERSTLELKGSFGHGGKNAGYFGWLHSLDVDSRGNIYTGEVEAAKRAQKFVRTN
ncbi:MAG: hypothetical protein WEC12_00330 [Balneolaceae bacterium]